jgi:hypothetical protein
VMSCLLETCCSGIYLCLPENSLAIFVVSLDSL